jgi:hypothetical protein
VWNHKRIRNLRAQENLIAALVATIRIDRANNSFFVFVLCFHFHCANTISPSIPRAMLIGFVSLGFRSLGAQSIERLIAFELVVLWCCEHIGASGFDRMQVQLGDVRLDQIRQKQMRERR